jgi:predicted ATPase
VLVGENGSGKSTVVETLAEAYGLNPQGGSALGQSWSYFLRADTMHQLYTYLEQNPGKSDDPWHELSHGEGFGGNPAHPGEPDRLLPDGRTRRAAVVHVPPRAGGAAARPGRRRVPAGRGHPLPILAAVPGANVLELGPWGIRPASWEDLSLVVAWRQFMRDPQGFFRHLFEA